MSEFNTLLDWAEVDRLFEQGLEVPTHEQESWLNHVAGNNPLLKEKVQMLLEADRKNQREQVPFLESADAVATEWLTGHYLKTDTVGPYRIVERIGSGGFGAVFKVLPVNDASKDAGPSFFADALAASVGVASPHRGFLALKIIHPWTLDAAAYRRFLTEQRALQRIDHPHVVRFVDAGVHEGLPYMVMHYIDGQPLDQVLRDDQGKIDCSRIPLATRIEWFRMICAGVAAAHHQLILHRDLKPSNILIDRTGKAIVTDFGLAKSVSTHGTVSFFTSKGHLVGTLPFMSPEQIHGETSLQLSSDVYGLGALLYFLLTGQPPHRSADFAQTCQLITTASPQSPRSFDSKISRDLSTICLHCLNKSPRRRYLSAERLLDDVGRYLDGLPIHARPVGKLEAAYYWARRSPSVAGLSAALFMLGLTSLITFFFLWADAQRNYRMTVQRNHQLLATIRQLTDQVELAESDPRTLRLQVEMLRTVTEGYRVLVSESSLDTPTLRNAAVAWFKLGRAECQQGNREFEFIAYQRAEECVRRVLSEDANNIEDLFDLFHCVAAQNRLNEALEIIQSVVDRDSTQDPYYKDALCDTLLRISTVELLKGVTPQLREQIQKCYSTAQALVEENSDKAIFWVKLGQCDRLRCQLALVDGDVKKALKCYRRSVKHLGAAHRLESLHAGTFFEFGGSLSVMAVMELANNNVARAVNCLKQLETLLDEEESTFSAYALSHTVRSRFLQAKMLLCWNTGAMSQLVDYKIQYENLLRQRLAVVPACPHAQAELASLISDPNLTLDQDLGLALELVQSAANNSSATFTDYLRGQIHYRRGEWQEAFKHFEQYRVTSEDNWPYMGPSADLYRIYRLAIAHDSELLDNYLGNPPDDNHDLATFSDAGGQIILNDSLEWSRHIFNGHLANKEYFLNRFTTERHQAIKAWKNLSTTLEDTAVVRAAVDSAKKD